MHPPHVRAAALALVDQGLNDCEISRRLGIPRGTIRDWRRPTYAAGASDPARNLPALLAFGKADALLAG